jgi:hypothetical protein
LLEFKRSFLIFPQDEKSNPHHMTPGGGEWDCYLNLLSLQRKIIAEVASGIYFYRMKAG